MTKYYACLAAITLLILVPNAEARVQEQILADWRTFEVPDFGTRIQYGGVYSLRLASLKWVLDSGLSARTDVLSCPFTLVLTEPGDPERLFKKTSPRGAVRVGLRTNSAIILRHLVRA